MWDKFKHISGQFSNLLSSENTRKPLMFCCFQGFPVGIYLLKLNSRNTRTRCEICSKSTIKKPERHQWLGRYVKIHRIVGVRRTFIKTCPKNRNTKEPLSKKLIPKNLIHPIRWVWHIFKEKTLFLMMSANIQNSFSMHGIFLVQASELYN